MDRHITRIGIVGDVHTECQQLETVLDHLRNMGVDRILCTGDLADGPLGAEGLERCCELLESHGVLTICGNHDRWLQEDSMRDLRDAVERDELEQETLDYLEALPITLELDSSYGAVQLCHGLGEDDMALVMPHDHAAALDRNGPLQALLASDTYRLLINGHSHRPMVKTIGSLTIINGGTLLRGERPCCTVADLDRRQVLRFGVGPDGGLGEPETLALP